MKFHSIRSSLAVFAALSAAVLLSACGGGGAAGNPNQGGPISVSPANGTFYAGVPARITMSGGRRPYSMTSSEPGILDVPAVVDANFVDVIPNNPGVVDANLQPNDLPRRTVTISVRDTTGILVLATIAVGQNFLTGYGLFLTPNTCPIPQSGAAVTACAGGRTSARLSAVFNGSLAGNRDFRLSVVSGNFSLTDPVTGLSGSSLLARSDHTGTVLTFIDVPANATGGLGVIRVTDAATGVYADQVFVITPAPPVAARTITLIPSTISLTGSSTTRCGIGSSDVLAFDGLPPYAATSTDQSILVTPTTSPSQPGRFTITVIKENPPCITNGTVVITDSSGARATVTVNSVVGTRAPPPLVVSPATITLACGATGSVSVIGGSGSYSVNSSNGNVTGVIGGNTLSITRSSGGGAQGVPGGTSTVSVTDGATVANVVVTSPQQCGPP